MVGASTLAASLNDFARATASRASSNLRSVEAAAAALAAVDAAEQVQPPPQPAQPEVNQADVATLMDMGFPRERCIEALTANSR